MKKNNLESFLNAYILRQKEFLKQLTISHIGETTNLLLDFFGNEKEISEFTQADGQDFFNYLKSKCYAHTTISRIIRRAIDIFKFAQQSKILVNNPFLEIKLPKQTNPVIIQFVDLPTIQKVLNHCPNNQWKLIICLARFGGLRIPSELVGLTWDCVNWDKGTITVRSPKTENTEGGGFREVPLSPEIKTLLSEALKDAPIGEKRIIPNVKSATNLRQGLIRIIKNAGVPVWKKLFQNLRASKATEVL